MQRDIEMLHFFFLCEFSGLSNTVTSATVVDSSIYSRHFINVTHTCTEILWNVESFTPWVIEVNTNFEIIIWLQHLKMAFFNYNVFIPNFRAAWAFLWLINSFSLCLVQQTIFPDKTQPCNLHNIKLLNPMKDRARVNERVPSKEELSSHTRPSSPFASRRRDAGSRLTAT